MATIGSLNVNLGLSTAAFAAGAKKAQSVVTGLASSVSSAAGAVPGLGTAIAGIGAALSAGAVVAGLQSVVSSSMDAIDTAGDLSARLGTSTEALTRLQYATQLTGSETESLTGSLEKMNANLGKAKDGSEVSKVLSDIGLDAEELKRLDPAEAFIQIADGISGLATPADKSAAAMAVFGKQGAAMLNTINAGGDAIRELTAESDKLGNTITDVDAAKVGAANDALDKMWKVFGGIGNRLTLEVVPYIEVAATKIAEFALEGDLMGKILTGAFTLVTESIVIIADSWDLLALGFKGAQYLITKGIAFLVQGIATLGDGIVWLANKLGADIDNTFLTTLAEDLHRTADGIGDDLNKALIEPSSGEKVRKFFSDVQSGAQKAAEAAADAAKQTRSIGDSMDEAGDGLQKLIDKFKEEDALFQFEGRTKEIEKLKRDLDLTEDELKQARALAADLDKREQDKKNADKLKDEANQLKEQLQTPLDKFEEQREKLKQLVSEDLLSQDEANKLFTKAGEEFISSTGGTSEIGKGNAALERGSAAAFSAAVNQPTDRVAQNTKLSAEILQRIERLQREALAKQGETLTLN